MSNSAELNMQERQSLLSNLLDAVKQCQIRFGGRTELATESDSRVVCLCTQFEIVLQHGIRRNSKGFLHLRHVTEMIKGLNLLNPETDIVFWHFTRMILNKHEYERYMLLKNINTDIGRGRAWLRSSLNEHSLERYMHMMLADPNQICQFYEDWAFMMDQERSSMLPMMAAGLGSILFAININNADLNSMRTSRPEFFTEVVKSETEGEILEPQPVISKFIRNTEGRKRKKKKRPSSQLVSFDDDDIIKESMRCINHVGECSSAPATCLSSPVQITVQFPAFTSTHIPPSQSVIVEHIKDGTSFNKIDLPTSESVNTYSENISTILKNTIFSVEAMADKSVLTSESSPEVKEKQLYTESDPVVSRNQSQSFRTSGIDTNQNSSESNSFSFPLQKTNHDKISLPHLPRISPGTSFVPDKADQCNTHFHTTLTPVGDASVGELIPVNQIEDIICSEDSLSIPSYGEDMDNAVAALAIAQRVPSWSVSSANSHTSRKGSEPRSRSETLTMSAEELREAVLVVLQKREEAEEKNNALRSLLDREMEMSSGLRAELAEVQKHHEEKVERLEIKLQTVSRENELLKHQLRKYIAAVQTLKHDSSKLNELASDVVNVQPAIPEPKPYIDHQYEAGEYEKKLVQVAEMHGELMEFNDRLHRLLLQRESALRRLRDELIDLRGPLPDDNQTSDDDISITSDYDASSQTAMLRPLINVWIPSAFLTGHSTDIHHVYQVYIRIRDDEWNVYRRYAQFYALHRFLKKKDPIVNTFDFPPKKTIGKKDAKVVEQRRRQLQHYLRSVLNWMLQTNADLSNSPDKETFIILLPFFGDQPSEQRKQMSSHRNTSAYTRGLSSSPTNQERAIQHYTGL